jgi:hypothetical protein
MIRRVVVLSALLVVASQLSTGCCHWRPFCGRFACWPHCYGPANAAAYPAAAPDCACYPPGQPAMGGVPQGQPVFMGPAVPYGHPQVTPGASGVPNPMAPTGGAPKN